MEDCNMVIPAMPEVVSRPATMHLGLACDIQSADAAPSVDQSQDSCFMEKSHHVKGYMRHTISSQAKTRPRAEKPNPRSKYHRSRDGYVQSSTRSKMFISKIPQPPGMSRPSSLDSARNGWRAESVFSMTDTAREGTPLSNRGSPMRCSNAAVQNWLDGCEAEWGQIVPKADLQKICLTRSNSGKTWVVYAEQDSCEGRIGMQKSSKIEEANVPAPALIKEEEEEENGSVGRNGLEKEEHHQALGDASGRKIEEEKVEEKTACDHHFTQDKNKPEEGNDSRGQEDVKENVVNGHSKKKGPFNVGHVFTFLLGIGTMTVLGALK